MTEQKAEKTFEPITTQEEFDERIKSRLARERERWQKESGTEDLKAELEAKEQEISSIKREQYLKDARRAVISELAKRGATDDARVHRIMRLVDLEAIEPDADGEPARRQVLKQIDSVASDVPELVKPRGAGSRGSSTPVLEKEEPLTREQIESMSPEEQRKPGMKERIDRFLAGHR